MSSGIYLQEENIEKDVRNLRKENENLSKEKTKLELASKKKEETIKHLETSVSRITYENNQMTKKCNLLESSVEKLKAEEVKIRNVQIESEEIIKELGKQIKAISEEKPKAEQQLQNKLDELITEREREKKVNTDLEKQLRLICEEKKKLENKLEDMATSQMQLKKKYEELYRTQEEHEKHTHQLEKESKKNKDVLSNIKNQTNKADREIKSLQKENDLLAQQLEENKKHYLKELTNMEDEIVPIKEGYCTFGIDIKSYKTEGVKCREEIQTKIEDLEERVAKITIHEGDTCLKVDVIAKDLKQLKSDIDIVETDKIEIIKRQEVQKEQLQSLVKSRNKLVELHQRELNALKQKLDERNGPPQKTNMENLIAEIEKSGTEQHERFSDCIKQMRLTEEKIEHEKKTIGAAIEAVSSKHADIQTGVKALEKDLDKFKKAQSVTRDGNVVFSDEVDKFLQNKEMIKDEYADRFKKLEEKLQQLQATQADAKEKITMHSKHIKNLRSDTSKINTKVVGA